MTELKIGDVVVTAYGEADVIERPFQMASGTTVKVRYRETEVTASGEGRLRVDEVSRVGETDDVRTKIGTVVMVEAETTAENTARKFVTGRLRSARERVPGSGRWDLVISDPSGRRSVLHTTPDKVSSSTVFAG